MAADILQRAGEPLHANDIIEQIKKIHGVDVDRESLVSALSKKVQRGDRFVRPGPNQFALGSNTRRSR
jgi:DNA-directed RNA polymerase delta subunit